MKKSFAFALLLTLIACKAPTSSAPATPLSHPAAFSPSPPPPDGFQNFDYYLLNLSWSPEFCYSHASAPECGHHATLVLHGLWPQNSDGTYPENCSSDPGPSDPASFSDLYPDPGLLAHEWKTHGTCSGLTPDHFFLTARDAFKAFVIPPQLAQLDTQISLPPSQILSLVTRSNPSLLGASLAVSCGNNYLTAIEVCLNKQLHPTACGAIRSCRANTVRIPPP